MDAMIQYADLPSPPQIPPSVCGEVTWPCDREAVRFQVLSRPDHRGLRKIRALFWKDGRQAAREQMASLDALIASARRRSVPFDVIEYEAAESEAA